MGWFKKSPEKLAHTIFSLAKDVGEGVAKQNHLQFPEGSLVHTRFVINAHIFSNLLCQDIVMREDTDRNRAFGVCKFLTEQHIASISQSGTSPVRFTDIAVWNDELESIRRYPINPKLAGANLDTVFLPLADIVREIHVVRLARMCTDLLKGAAAQKGSWSLALLTPMCSSLIMQTTADEQKAADENITSDFAASLLAHWMFLQVSVQEVTK